MDAYVQQILIRQQIAESDRLAALRHLVRAARAPRARTSVDDAVRQIIRSIAGSWPRRPAPRVTAR